MPRLTTVNDMELALTKRMFPALTQWNRLEGRPRTHHFDRALKAEVRDALWMLTKQWQMGEFKGCDAGSPVLARILSASTYLRKYQAKEGDVEDFSLDEPLETKVERRPVPWRVGDTLLRLDLRAAVGRRWMKMLAAARDRGDLSNDYRKAYLTNYAIASPDPSKESQADICAHLEGWQQVTAMARRLMDGVALLEHAAEPGHAAHDDVEATSTDEATLDSLADTLAEWLRQWISQPNRDEQDAWLPRKLEYQFGCSAPLRDSDLVVRAEEYYQGHLDWYALEQTDESSLAGTSSGLTADSPNVHTFIPVGISFAGMPKTRWWEFEDQRTSFGEIKPDTTDLGKLLLMEFGLVYANDWFVFPFTLPIGSISEIKGVAVTNVFGERTWVEPASSQPTSGWQTWSMFQMRAPGDAPATLALLPAAAQVQNGKPLEEIALVRDEVANMVWAIEKRISLPSGKTKPGQEAARETYHYLERIIGAAPEPASAAAPIRYQVMNTVPENWIPFIPVRVAESSREIQLQRAAMPRLLGDDPASFDKIRPRTTLMRENWPQAYYIDEEEVPRVGASLKQAFQRTRWLNGKVHVWLGISKSTGRGEGMSGLAFDLLADSKKS